MSLTPSCALALGKKPPALEQPQEELCVLGDGGCLCFDPRLPAEQQSYVLSFSECKNHIATNVTDYNAKQDWIRANCWGKPK
jgi:hypothetical protein